MVPGTAIDADAVDPASRSVPPQSAPHGGGSMDVIGAALFVGPLLLLVPLPPLLVTVWLVAKGRDVRGAR